MLTNRGGEIEHWILKKYQASDGKPLDLVQQQVAESFGFPLQLFTYDSSLSKQLNDALYQVTVSGSQSARAQFWRRLRVTFRYAANGVDAVKTIHFGSDYVVDVDAEVKQNGAPVRALVEWPAGLGDMEEFCPGSLTEVADSNFRHIAGCLVG